MKDRGFSKFLNTILFVAIVFAVFIWSAVNRNISASPTNFEVQVSFLDVGQADAELINLPNSVQILTDGGRDSSVLGPLSKKMPRFDRKIEYVFLSQPDSDHIGGMSFVLDSYSVGEIFETNAKSESKTFEKLKNKIKEKNIKETVVQKGQKIDFSPNASGLILNPDENQIGSLSSNDSSIVMKLDYKGATALFTGDAEIEAQDKIMANFTREQIQSEILKVAHHGSGGALNKNFLNEVKPKYAVVSVGKNNSYGHPSKTVLQALGEINAEILRTDEIGTIDFVSNGGSWTKK
ncbi:MAG: MBL fold metallo-hydrolase [Candidatus Berkelbacteria bacterium]|nr:MBL fold metallo-hydrolase [Candidatus Berkelbacteria bacterium]